MARDLGKLAETFLSIKVTGLKETKQLLRDQRSVIKEFAKEVEQIEQEIADAKSDIEREALTEALKIIKGHLNDFIQAEKETSAKYNKLRDEDIRKEKKRLEEQDKQHAIFAKKRAERRKAEAEAERKAAEAAAGPNRPDPNKAQAEAVKNLAGALDHHKNLSKVKQEEREAELEHHEKVMENAKEESKSMKGALDLLKQMKSLRESFRGGPPSNGGGGGLDGIVRNGLRGILDFEGHAKKVGGGLTSFFRTVFSGIASMGKLILFKGLLGVFGFIGSAIQGVFKGAVSLAKSTFSIIGSIVKGAVNTVIGAVSGIMSLFKGAVSITLGLIKSTIKATAIGIAGLVGAISFATILKAQGEEGSQAFKDAFGSMSKTAEDFYRKLASDQGKGVSATRNRLTDLMNEFRGADDDLINPFDEQASSAKAVELLARAHDLAAKHKISDAKATKILSAAISGNTSDMQKLGYEFDEIEMIQAVAARGYRTVAEAAGTFGGRMAIAEVILRRTNKAQGAFNKNGKTLSQIMIDVKDKFIDAWKSLGSIFLPAATVIFGELDKMIGLSDDTANAMESLGKRLGQSVERFVERIKRDLTDGTTFIGMLRNATVKLFSYINSIDFDGFFNAAVDVVKDVVEEFNKIKESAMRLFKGIVPNGKVDWELFKDYAVASFNTIKGHALNLAATITDSLSGVVPTFVKLMVNGFDRIMGRIKVAFVDFIEDNGLQVLHNSVIMESQRKKKAAAQTKVSNAESVIRDNAISMIEKFGSGDNREARDFVNKIKEQSEAIKKFAEQNKNGSNPRARENMANARSEMNRLKKEFSQNIIGILEKGGNAPEVQRLVKDLFSAKEELKKAQDGTGLFGINFKGKDAAQLAQEQRDRIRFENSEKFRQMRQEAGNGTRGDEVAANVALGMKGLSANMRSRATEAIQIGSRQFSLADRKLQQNIDEAKANEIRQMMLDQLIEFNRNVGRF